MHSVQVLYSMEQRDRVQVQEHHGKLVLTEQHKVGLYELGVLEHVGGNLGLGCPPALARGPPDGNPLGHVHGDTKTVNLVFLHRIILLIFIHKPFPILTLKGAISFSIMAVLTPLTVPCRSMGMFKQSSPRILKVTSLKGTFGSPVILTPVAPNMVLPNM